jgi:hypothetical protein
MVGVLHDDVLMMMINEIDYVDDDLNVNVRYFDERIFDHRSNHFVNVENIPAIEKNIKLFFLSMKISTDNEYITLNSIPCIIRENIFNCRTLFYVTFWGLGNLRRS